jgi:seryl-tRNA synthetase
MANITTVNAATGEVVEREMTAQEKAEVQKLSDEMKEIKDELDARAAARESALAKLAKLGLTQAEIEAL